MTIFFIIIAIIIIFCFIEGILCESDRISDFNIFLAKFVNNWYSDYLKHANNHMTYFEVKPSQTNQKFEFLSLWRRIIIKKTIKQKYPGIYKNIKIFFTRSEGFGYFPYHTLHTYIKK